MDKLSAGRTVVLVLVLILVGGCQIGPVNINVDTPTSGEVSTLTYQAPIALTVKAGEIVLGTNIRYVGQSEERAELIIGGQTAFKQVADSVDWSGSPANDVDLDLRSRIVRFNEEQLNVAGTATVKVQAPMPEADTVPENAPIEYRAPVVYAVALGGQIPGTLIDYEGPSEQGAELSGVEGFPYRKRFDSIVWEGKLKPNVYLRLDVRVVRFTEDALNVTGLATVSIAR